MADAQSNSSGKPTPDLNQLLKDIGLDAGKGAPLPPVERWEPDNCGDIGMEIRADGSWWHEGGRIGRDKLVKLFSRILRKDSDGRTYLVTPHEKVLVHVHDAPFLAVRVDRLGAPGPDQILTFVTNLGDVALAGPDCPLRVDTDPATDQPAPYVLVRGRLEAKLTRAVFHDLAAMVVASPHDGGASLGVWSQGAFFPIGPAGEDTA